MRPNMPDVPRLVVTDGVTEELVAVNGTGQAWLVTLSAEFWQTVDKTTGQALRHGPRPRPVTLLPGQHAPVGDIHGWEWDSQLEMTLVCRDAAGREVSRNYWLNAPGARESRETVPGFGEVRVPEPTGKTMRDTNAAMPEGGLTEQRSWALTNNDGWACCRLGRAYETGDGVAVDPCTAALWYHLGATLGDAGCQAGLARLLADGTGVPQDETAARGWHQRAAEGGEAGSALWLADHSRDAAEALTWLRHGCRAGDRRCMIGAAKLLIDGEEAAQWLQRAAELGEPEAQIRLAEMLATEDAWPRHRVEPDREEAAYWLNAAGRRRLPPELRTMAETVVRRTGLPLPKPPREPSVLAWRMRQLWWRLCNLLPIPELRPVPLPPLLPVAELDFADLPRLGDVVLQTLMRRCDHHDFVLALLPGAVGEVSRPVRHFVLNNMSSRAAAMIARDMLVMDVSDRLEAPHRSQAVMLDHLRDLVDDGETAVPADLAEELRQRERRVATPRDVEDASPRALELYGFSTAGAEYRTRHQALARRISRGEPTPPPEDPFPGWYADHLDRQPNAILRAAMKALGEGDLLCFLAGASPFLRFRVWHLSTWALRTRLVHGVEGSPSHPATSENYAAARLAMDAALRQAHRHGNIGWWDA